MGFGRAEAARTRSSAIYTTLQGPPAKRVWVVGRGPGRGVRPNRPRSSTRHDRLVSRPGNDPRLAEGGRVRTGQGIRPDRGRNSPGRGDQPLAPERRPARAGGGRRGHAIAPPASGASETKPGSRCWSDTPTISSCSATSRQQAEQVKARLAEWLAPRGLVLQRGQDADRPPRRGFDFLGFNVRRYRGKLLIKPSKAAIRRLRERLATEMRSAARLEREGGHRQAQPDHPGMGRLLPGSGVVQGVLTALDTTCGGSPTSGPTWQPPEQVEDLDRRPLLRQVQQVQERPMGVRRPRQQGAYLVKFSWTDIVRHRWSAARRPPTTPP